ncbi:MAG: tail fiber domain-containing protein [Leptolyngbyaceae cyanobacterium RM2_2_4]|nr:tail fiber domain-containing protein [Leptolyngbyaceae cyanobacterium RM2_2_4]
MGSSSSKVDNSYSRKPWFTFPGSEELASSLLNRTNENLFDPSNTYRKTGMDFFSNMAQGQPMEFSLSNELKSLIESIRSESANALPDQLAQTRSAYYRAPTGRNLMGLDESVNDNTIRRDTLINQLLTDQFNKEVGFRSNAATNLLQGDASDFAQAMQLASMLIGEKGKGTGSSRATNYGNTIAGIGQFMGGLGDLGVTGSGIMSALGLGGSAALGPIGAATPALASVLGGLSDRRLKTNIIKLGTHVSGIGLYAFNYIWDVTRRFVGVMADELEKIHPEMVEPAFGHYKKVRYDLLNSLYA